MTRRYSIRTSALSLAACLATACGTPESAAEAGTDSVATAAPVSQVVDVGADAIVPDSERAFGTITVSGATPDAGDGTVQVTRRTPVDLPGVASAFAIEGVAGAMEHSFLIALDSAGAVKLVTHKWHNADNSVVAQTECGARAPCSPRLVGANPESRTVLFSRLVLTGLDGNTAQEATSTLTGAVP